MRRLLLAFVTLTTACSTYSVRRAALVPHMAPVTTTGQPMEGPVELALGSTNLGATGAPEQGSSGGGLYIPRVDVNGALRARLGKGTVGLIVDYGSGDGATATSNDIPHPDGNTWGWGAMMAYSFGEGPFHLGLELDLLRYSIPWKETWTCIDGCEYDTMSPYQAGTQDIFVGALGLVPSYRTGDWVVHGGATIRNHPTIDKGDVLSFEIFEPVEGGPLNLVLSAGAEYRLGGLARIGLTVFQPLGSDPVAYGPTVAAQLTVGVPDAAP